MTRGYRIHAVDTVRERECSDRRHRSRIDKDVSKDH